MQFEFISQERLTLDELFYKTRVKGSFYNNVGINKIDNVYEVITKVGNHRYEHFLIPVDHIYYSIDAYVRALLSNNSREYGCCVRLVSFNEMYNSVLPKKLFTVGGK